MISIIDYGVNNIGSVANMLRHIGVDFNIIDTNDLNTDNSNGLILPGIGHFGHAMSFLKKNDFDKKIVDLVKNKNLPILGICLGMQLLCKRSEEGDVDGLGLVDADVVRFASDKTYGLRVPHMSWCYVEENENKYLYEKLPLESKFYIVHSYHVNCKKHEDIWLSAKYGDNFTAGFISGHVIGCQFHPEKSHKHGMNLLKNFSRWCSN